MDVIFGSPPPDGDRDRGATVMVVYWTAFIVCFVLMCLRFWARIKIRAVGLDDWTMAFAVLLLSGLSVAGTFLIRNGGCRHLYYLVQDEGLDGIVTVSKIFYICQPFAIMCIAIGRISVALLVLRIMVLTVWRKRFLWFSIISTFIISALNSVLLFAACTPAEAVWNPFIPSKCWDAHIMTNVTIFTSSWNVLMDFCFAALPISVFWNLRKLSLKKRVGLSTLTGMGILAGISGAIKTSKLYEANANDITWGTYDLFLSNAAETFLIIICGCLPTLRPLYLQLFKRPGNSASGGPSHPLPGLPFSRKLKISDASDSSNNEQYTRIVEPNKPSINASLINVGHPIDINTWTESEQHEMMPTKSPHRTEHGRSGGRQTSRAVLEV